jgi:hypothetical protein
MTTTGSTATPKANRGGTIANTRSLTAYPTHALAYKEAMLAEKIYALEQSQNLYTTLLRQQIDSQDADNR